jgi:hypothetical protein
VLGFDEPVRICRISVEFMKVPLSTFEMVLSHGLLTRSKKFVLRLPTSALDGQDEEGFILRHNARSTSIIQDIRRRHDGRGELSKEISSDVFGAVGAHPLVISSVCVVEGLRCHVARYLLKNLGSF